MNIAQNKSHWSPMAPPPDITDTGFLVGTSGYYYDDWMGIFNPPKLSKARLEAAPEHERESQDRLRFYQKYFPLVEVNHTFYREPIQAAFVDMERRSRGRTQYIVKAHRDISHKWEWDTANGMSLMEKHVQAVSPLAETGRFYSFLIQLEDRLERRPKILDYLLSVSSVALSNHLDVHIEFRHISWHHEYVLQKLKDNGIGICNTEIPSVPHVFPLKAYATTSKGYIRYSGRNLEHWYPEKKGGDYKDRLASRNARYNYEYTKQELEQRVIKQFELRGKTEKTAVAFNNHFQAQAVRNAIANVLMIREKYLGSEKGNGYIAHQS